MANEVKIKLSADGKQVREQIKLIDRDLQQLGNSTIGGKSDTRDKSSYSSKSERSSDRTLADDSRAKAKQEARDKVDSQTLRELTLVRKELQKINGYGGNQGYSGNGGSGNNGGGGNGNPPALPGPISGGGNGDGNGSGKNIGQAAGKLLTAAVALKAITSAYSSLKNSAQSAQTGASLAFTTYGSTLAYSDYNQARKDASNMGAPYGFDSTIVMNAGTANMSLAGIKGDTREEQLENYNNDMDALLRTSKYLGIDAGNLSGISGFMSSIGVTESGEQKKFADLLAESIVEAEMTGREDEQLRVLENIAENLASRNTSVSGDQLTSSLGMYNALINQNENLKGTRGADIVTSMQDLAASGNSSLDILAGFGTKYTGLSGQLELRKLAEENPEQYWSQVYEGVQQYGLGDDYFKKLLYDNVGSVSQAEEIMSALPEIAQGTYKITDTTAGENLLDNIEENYRNDKISTEEQHDVEKQEASDDRGNFWNNATEPFEKFYNWLPDWAKQGVDIGEGVGKFGAGIFGAKAVGQAFGNWRATGNIFNSGTGGGAWKNFWGKGGGAADDVVNAAANSADDVVIDLVEGSDGVWREAGSVVDDVADDIVSNSVDDIVANGADDVVNALSNGADDLVNATANSIDDITTGLANTVDDVLANSADDVLSALGNGAKNIFGKSLGPLIQLGFGAYNYATADDDWERGGAVGQTGGGIVGGLLGSVLGPLGSIAGGWAGGELGEAIGESATTGEKNWGSIFAGDWNPLYGLWRKNGTITQQKLNGTYDWSDEEVTVKNSDGTTSTSTVGEIEEQNHKVYNDWTVNNAEDVDAFQKALASHTDNSGNIDLSFMNGVDMDTANMLFKSVFGEDVFSSGKLNSQQYLLGSGQTLSDVTWGKGESEFYGSQLSGSSLLEDANKIEKLEESNNNLNDTLSDLNMTVDGLKQYLQNNYGLTSNQANMYYSTNKSNLETKSSSTWYKPWTWFSHATGNDYVPYDNYTALLHRGEMVLTAPEADDYRQGKVGNGNGVGTSHATSIDININLSGSVSGMTPDNQDVIVQSIIAQINSSSELKNMISNGYKRVQNY